jgi:hypothetical protein
MMIIMEKFCIVALSRLANHCNQAFWQAFRQTGRPAARGFRAVIL